VNQIQFTQLVETIKSTRFKPNEVKKLKQAIETAEELINDEDLDVQALKTTGVRIGNRLKALRKEVGLTQDALVKKSRVSQSTISKIEKAEKIMTIAEAKKLARALGVKPEFFVTG
jgi:DNA-binding XRE family transcriptional regulator